MNKEDKKVDPIDQLPHGGLDDDALRCQVCSCRMNKTYAHVYHILVDMVLRDMDCRKATDEIMLLMKRAMIYELDIAGEKLSDLDASWGDVTEGSEKEWGKNHADLWVPMREVDKLLSDRIKEIKGTAK